LLKAGRCTGDPKAGQFQIALAEVARRVDDGGKLFAGEIFSPTHAAIIARYVIILSRYGIFLHRQNGKIVAVGPLSLEMLQEL
jgi:hypothetical protein